MTAAHDCEERAGFLIQFFCIRLYRSMQTTPGLADRTGSAEEVADPTGRGKCIGAAAFTDEYKRRFLNISGATN
jgi:hypothetical protein